MAICAPQDSLVSVKKAAFLTLASFPPEIICLILQSMGEDFGRERQNFRLVSRSWNNLIVYASCLWKHIFIDKHSINGPADSKDTFEGTRMALERSHRLPINLTISLPNEGDNDIHSSRFTVEHVTLLSSLISPHTSRIASLCVQGSSHAHHLTALRNTFQVPMPLLRSATFIRDGLLLPGPHPYHSYDFADEPDPYPSILQCPYSVDVTVVNEWGKNHYPVLEHLSIIGVPFNYGRFPARNLTELRLVRREWLKYIDDDAMETLQLLQLASETLEVLEVVDFPLDHDDDQREIHFPKLRSLSLGYRRSQDGTLTFFSNLILCSMTELTLTNTNVLASLDAEVTPSQRQKVISRAERDDQVVIAEIMGSGYLCQLEKLTLNCVVFHGNCTDITPSTILREDVNEPEDLDDLELEIDVDNFIYLSPYHAASSRPLPITLAFIRMLPSLKHLDVRDLSGKLLYFMNYPVAYQSSAPYVRFNLDKLETCRIHTDDLSLATAFRSYRQIISPTWKTELQVYPPPDSSQIGPQFQRKANSGSQEELWDMTDEWSDVAAKLLPHALENDIDEEDDDDEEEDEEEHHDDDDVEEENDGDDEEDDEEDDDEDGEEVDEEEGEPEVKARTSNNPLRPRVFISMSLV